MPKKLQCYVPHLWHVQSTTGESCTRLLFEACVSHCVRDEQVEISYAGLLLCSNCAQRAGYVMWMASISAKHMQQHAGRSVLLVWNISLIILTPGDDLISFHIPTLQGLHWNALDISMDLESIASPFLLGWTTCWQG